jgi:hypothetical protein
MGRPWRADEVRTSAPEGKTGGIQFQYAMIELGALTAMTLSLVGCLGMLRKRAPGAVAERA